MPISYDYEQYSFTQNCFRIWSLFSGKSELTIADIYHSALLKRLMLNEPIFKHRPPRAMSYPWYSLLDNGIENAAEVCIHIRDAAAKSLGKDVININQSLWTPISVNSDGTEFEAEWYDDRFLTVMGQPDYYPWRVMGERVRDDTFGWRITLLTPPEIFTTDS